MQEKEFKCGKTQTLPCVSAFRIRQDRMVAGERAGSGDETVGATWDNSALWNCDHGDSICFFIITSFCPPMVLTHSCK